ncbi:carboxymethylenebutenolidase [Novosphingobium kunmingense]|uniref:Carboxymethylenebutenolidase n=1 Tax=Novosphingobium kunmingense TaxID=1211806 RepID=A0A2N0HK64_9SPHN|nr:dienelactone hydrolase family protein [Novosphingobium kunmingense]PKB19340.1 carboxymethylenebutenolidase [Novosphingobium kunmingense]
MCDDTTVPQEEAALSRLGFNRRQFAAAGAASMAAACADARVMDKGSLTEQMVKVATPDGTADAFFVRPARGTFPAVIVWPDIAGLRDAYKEMGRRLAREGYAVLVVNHYYRSSPAPVVASMAEWRTPEGQAKLKPMIAALSPAGTMRDARAFVAWLDKQRSVDTKKGVGTSGYCMGGPFTVRTAYAVPGRVRAAASFHGGGLVTDAADSPHRLLAATKAGYLFAVARNDDAKAPGDKDALRAAAAAAGRPAEIEVYNADHGWCTLDAPVYNEAEANRAWGRMLALFKTL